MESIMDPSSQMEQLLEDCIRNTLGQAKQRKETKEKREHMQNILEQVERVYRE